MEMAAYQRAAAKTIQSIPGGDHVAVALLGLAGETGAVLTAYKKHLRDGPANPEFRARMREELGDALWYLSTVAHHLDLGLDDIATANLGKITDRWRHTPADAIPFDADLEADEQLPRQADFVFTLTRGPEDREVSVLTCDGRQVGDPITNASHIADGYCFHDIFHLSYAAVLGWSPVMRSLLKRKRRSNPDTDEAEDGGRAIVIEEGIAALVFAYASRHNYLDGKNHVDNDILDTIQGMVAHLEVGAHRAADWEKAIVTGFAAWRRLRRQGGGTVHLDLDAQTLTVADPEQASAETPAAQTFKAVVTRLHRRKDASYGDAWKRRGEQISIMANIARKVDRLNIVAITRESTVDESVVDTAVGLYVYTLKYLTFLADTDPTVLPDVLPTRTDGTNWSDSPDGVERLLATADLAVLDTGVHQPIEILVATVDRTFADLERCFTGDGEPTPATRRAQLTTNLADAAIQIVAALRAGRPDLYHEFVQAWQK